MTQDLNAINAYLMRLQVRIGARLKTESTCLTATFQDREVSIRSYLRGDPISKEKWIVLEVGGFATKSEAQEFGERLSETITIGGVCAHLGADTGADDRVGISILPAGGAEVAMGMARLTVAHDPTQLLGAIEDISTALSTEEPEQVLAEPLATAFRLLNLAMIANDRPAKIVLAISAVEGLAGNQQWSERQKQWIADTAGAINDTGDSEMSELVEALQRMYRISLRQGVFRLLESAGLEHLKKEWDRVYSLRSGLFHGSREFDRRELNKLAQDIVKISVTIVLSMLQKRGFTLPQIAEVHFPSLP